MINCVTMSLVGKCPLFSSVTKSPMINHFWDLTCENCFVRLELPSADSERHVAKFLVLKQLPEIVGQPALRYFKLYRITLPGDVYAVRHHANLWR